MVISTCNARDAEQLGSIPGLGRSPGEGNDYPLQYSCLGNLMDRGAWWARVHGVAKSRTGLSMHTHEGLEFLFAKSGSCLETGSTALKSTVPNQSPGGDGQSFAHWNDSPMKILAQRTLTSSTIVSMGCVPKSCLVTLYRDSCGQDVRASTP